MIICHLINLKSRAHKNQAHVHDTSAQNSIQKRKASLRGSIPAPQARDKHELNPPYVIATSQHSLAHQIDF